MGDRRSAYCVLVGKPERDHMEHLGVYGTPKKWDGEAWAGLVWLRIGTGGGRL